MIMYAIVRPDGTIQKVYDVRFEATQPEIYSTAAAARFIRDKAYPSSTVQPVEITVHPTIL